MTSQQKAISFIILIVLFFGLCSENKYDSTDILIAISSVGVALVAYFAALNWKIQSEHLTRRKLVSTALQLKWNMVRVSSIVDKCIEDIRRIEANTNDTTYIASSLWSYTHSLIKPFLTNVQTSINDLSQYSSFNQECIGKVLDDWETLEQRMVLDIESLRANTKLFPLGLPQKYAEGAMSEDEGTKTLAIETFIDDKVKESLFEPSGEDESLTVPNTIRRIQTQIENLINLYSE